MQHKQGRTPRKEQMIQQGKNLQDMNVIELKARCFDIMVVIENMQRDLQETNQLIARKSRPEPIPVSEPVKEEVK